MSESSENSEAHSAMEAQRKLAQHHIERIKKEEEEEQWISGEELYTEGSSDEDDAAFRAKRRGKAARKNRRATPSKDVKQKAASVVDSVTSSETPTTSKSSNHVDNPDAVLNILTSEPKLESLSLSDEDDIGEVVTKISKQCNWTLADILENVTEPQECMLSEFRDSASEIFKTVEAFCISHAKSDQSRPQNEKSCHGETSDLQSAFLEMEKYDNLLEFMASKEREARETTNQLLLQIRNTLIELNGSQNLNGQLARNIKSFIQLHTEDKNGQDKPLVLPNLIEDRTKNSKAASITFMDHYHTSSPQKRRAEAKQRPKTTGAEAKTKSIVTRRVQSAVTLKKNEINFVQRNIESVSANVGAPLTEEEKQQLTVLLKEIQGMQENYASIGDVPENHLFSRSLTVKVAKTSVKISSTDLEENLETETAFVTLTKEENDKVKHLLEEKESEANYKYSGSEQKLVDIDRSLAALRTAALEDVDPIGEDEITNLLADYYKEDSYSSQALIKSASVHKNHKINLPTENQPQNLHEEGQSSYKSILDEETLKNLLNQAYKDLPNFKYRY